MYGRKLFKVIVITLLALCTDYHTSCIGQTAIQEKAGNDSHSVNGPLKRRDIYRNISTAQTYIKITAKDTITGKVLNLVLENLDFALFLAGQNGMLDEKGKVRQFEAFQKFIDEVYVDYMVKNEGKTFEINMADFEKFLAKSEDGKKHLERFVFTRPMTFEELGVTNEKDLLGKYFDWNEKEGRGILKSQKGIPMPAFIASLIDLGYVVGHGCVVPLIFIAK